jgi:diguanylate cyclase (GGDEF)-like protein/PAS domain S-box-containing protein
MSPDRTSASRNPRDTEPESLRDRAERYSADHARAQEAGAPADVDSVLHELRVHQIELEMQNEELRRAQHEIDSARAKYFDLYDMAPMGYVTVDSAGVVVEANLTAASLLGIHRDGLMGAPLSRLIVPDDADAYYLNMLKLKGATDSLDFQLRMIRVDQSFWVSVQARAVPSGEDSAEPVYRITFNDIDELQRALRAERVLAERFSAVVNGSHDIIYTLDAEGVVTFVSPSSAVLLGYGPAELVGRSFGDLVHKDDAARCLRALANVVRNSHKDAVVEYRIQHHDGTWRWFESTVAPMYDSRGKAVEHVGNARDITDRKFEAAEMQLLAMTDELTGIGNRRLFMSTFFKEFRRSRRYRYDLSLLMVDVDNLKAINDSLGHPVGDRALQLVARVCREACREVDEVCRLGGDEFAVVLPHSDGLTAFDVGERVREAIAAEPVPDGFPPEHRITVSVGAGTVLPDDAEQSELLERADQALRRAKQRGRNFTCA